MRCLAHHHIVFSWMLPFVSPWLIGNDYQQYPIENQMELMFAVKTGAFPLFIPGFAGGQSASALTLGGLWHPQTWLAAAMPGYWSGLALDWNTCLRLLSLGGTHLALLLVLRALRVKAVVAFILSFITVYNMRMLDLFRYGASLENYTGFLLLCGAILWHNLAPERLRGRVAMVGATYLLMTGGHPQMMYYGLLGAAVVALIAPHYVALMVGHAPSGGRPGLFAGYARVAGACAMGVGLASAYTLPFCLDFVARSAGRIGRDYAWADGFRDTVMGTVANAASPLAADVHGAFGGSWLVLPFFLIPLLRLGKRRLPKVIWVLWAAGGVLFLHMQGGRLPVHYAFWRLLPFASSFRIAGRATIVLLPLVMMALGWLWHEEAPDIEILGKVLPARVLLLWLSLGLCPVVFVGALSEANWSEMCPMALFEVPSGAPLVLAILGAGSLLALLGQGLSSASRRRWQLAAAVLVCMQTAMTLALGTWLWPRRRTPSLATMHAEKRESLDYRQHPGFGMSSAAVLRQARRAFVEPVLAKVYARRRGFADPGEVFRAMWLERREDTAYVAGLSLTDAQASLPDGASPPALELLHSSFNRLVFRAVSPSPAQVVLSHVAPGYWSVWVNGGEVPVLPANGLLPSVSVPRGTAVVEFRYWSWGAALGVLTSCGMLALSGGFLAFGLRSPTLRWAAVAASICGGLGLFFIWRCGLYDGVDLGMEFTWSGKAVGVANVAYGRRTELVGSDPEDVAIRCASSRAVNGDTRPGTGCETECYQNPAWLLDLGQVRTVRRVEIFATPTPGFGVNPAPLRVQLSVDALDFRTIAEFGRTGERPFAVSLTAGVAARYVRVNATGEGVLLLDEVQVFE
ncbi:MAG: hypothetical protein HON70_20795 [Lentisphaerae bacterium]|nr:hypothetical protein [Lentisphaerota bacterium]